MSNANTITLDAGIRTWLDHLRVERGVARNTLLSYARDLRRYRDYLLRTGITDLRRVTTTTVTAFLMDLREGADDRPALSTASAARCLVAVRGLHRFLHAEGATDDDPGQDVAPPRPAQRLPKAIGLTEIERLLAAASIGDTPVALRDRALLELLYGCGARISEAVGLDIDDIDITVGTVRIHGKGGKMRILPLGQFSRDALSAYLVRGRPTLAAAGTTGGPALFLNQRGARLSRQSAWALLQNVADRAGLRQSVSPHTLRHSFATHMLEGGADVRVVQELLGHASVTTTQIYTLVTVQHLREVYAQTHPRAR
ncbi:Tyrosine recombinase XerD [Austwickia sp. TVS 96-490-7B]|uniref:site-specific tyrosine recombinase XerD n=1 Tax=Austwickia sp. TVS 96-490-7B TaxID=2830843 RepID=UPI001D4E047E|nr:site-specific tyrosine recombinase XerD [Austwickia sp. TVS 96-490-7B]MBW3086295.1 Tyrosine recombinase XerD [Austwickia sp. TVS 96-490-7B]